MRRIIWDVVVAAFVFAKDVFPRLHTGAVVQSTGRNVDFVFVGHLIEKAAAAFCAKAAFRPFRRVVPFQPTFLCEFECR